MVRKAMKGLAPVKKSKRVLLFCFVLTPLISYANSPKRLPYICSVSNREN